MSTFGFRTRISEPWVSPHRRKCCRPLSVWVALGGVATALAFPLAPIPGVAPVALWFLAWVGLVPFLARLLTCDSLVQAAKTGLVFGIGWFLVAAVWVFRVFDVLGWVLIWLPVAWVILFALAARLTHRAGFPPALAWPLLWIAVEFARSEWSPIRLDWFSSFLDPLRFSWLLLGHSRLAVPVLRRRRICGAAMACLWPRSWPTCSWPWPGSPGGADAPNRAGWP